MDKGRVQDLVAYCLAVASRMDDYADRELAPIHLIKLLYLADLAYAEAHEGRTFTGATWKFWKLGPYDSALAMALEPILGKLPTQFRTRTHVASERSTNMWSLLPTASSSYFERLDRSLPSECTLRIARAIREYGNTTPSLLGHVYATDPMLGAAPGEPLAFAPRLSEGPMASGSSLPSVSRTQLKQLKARLKQVSQAGLEADMVTNPPEPIYDEVFEEGVAWLDSLAGFEVSPSSGVLEIDESLWKSEQRRHFPHA